MKTFILLFLMAASVRADVIVLDDALNIQLPDSHGKMYNPGYWVDAKWNAHNAQTARAIDNAVKDYIESRALHIRQIKESDPAQVMALENAFFEAEVQGIILDDDAYNNLAVSEEKWIADRKAFLDGKKPPESVDVGIDLGN